MATLEKLIKAFDALKVFHAGAAGMDETMLRKKEKMNHCLTIADAMCNPSVRGTSDFARFLGVAVETFLQLCDDTDADVRIVADESLNRTIRVLAEGNIARLQVELYKEIKKNGSARSLRAALGRFAELCHMIRPHKCRAYVINLWPCVGRIATRPEEPVQESLAASLQKIFPVLGNFTNDNEVKNLLKAFFPNLSSTSAITRRAAASSLLSLSLHGRKPQLFLPGLLNSLLDSVIPVKDDRPTTLLLGTLGCIRQLIPHLVNLDRKSVDSKGAFSIRGTIQDSHVSVDRLLQLYELCLYLCGHSDHNVATASLETLLQLLQTPPPHLLQILLSPVGIQRSRIHAAESHSPLENRSMSQMSLMTSMTEDDAALLDTESEISWLTLSDKDRDHPLEEFEIDESSERQGKEDDSSEVDRRLEEWEAGRRERRLASSSDRLDTPISEDPSVEKDLQSVSLSPSRHSPPSCEIGSMFDADIPLIYCVRLLSSTFLLDGEGKVLSDSHSRVSLKDLALGCIGSVLRLYPRAFFLQLAKEGITSQRLSDILRFALHSDPQIRGRTSCVVGSFLQAALRESGGHYELWANDRDTQLKLTILLHVLSKGLGDSSAITCHLSLRALKGCLAPLLESANNLSALPILQLLLPLSSHSYWLVKVELAELLCSLQYITLSTLPRMSDFQERAIKEGLIPLVGDIDARIRQAVASAFVKLVDRLFYPMDGPCYGGDPFLTKASLAAAKYLIPYGSTIPKSKRVEGSLSRLLAHFLPLVLTPCSKHVLFGCYQSLSALAEAFPPISYPEAWGCIINQPAAKPSVKTHSKRNRHQSSETTNWTTSGLFTLSLTVLTSSATSLDLILQQHLLNFIGALFKGIAAHNLQSHREKTDSESAPTFPLRFSDSHKLSWVILQDRQAATGADQLLLHLLRLLYMFAQVIEESSVPGKSNLSTSSLSPIRRRTRGSEGGSSSGPGASLTERGRGPFTRSNSMNKEEKSEEKKGHRVPAGHFQNLPHYVKLYELIRGAYASYKVSLESQSSRRVIGLLQSVLQCLSSVLEVCGVNDIGVHSDELLTSLRSCFILQGSATLHCVRQLLHALFGTNLGGQIENSMRTGKFVNTASNVPSQDKVPVPSPEGKSFFHQCFGQPYSQVVESLNHMKEVTAVEIPTLNMKRTTDRRNSPFHSLNKGMDKASLASYIRLFEPVVIKALKLYTVSSDVDLQCEVLQLLIQLVCLRVNYCLLDSEQIFIGFVIKQLEYIEEGQIPQSGSLVPHIFRFLVLLSYERNHSKSIITVPKIIQLCDGIMASGQDPVTHVIPALLPVVDDLFLVRGSSTTDLRELETQREVLFSMMLRLVHYAQVLELIVVVLQASQRENEERWRKWSRQAVDAVLPLLMQQRVQLSSKSDLNILHSLFAAVAPSVFRPVDPLLKALFVAPPDLSSLVAIERWMGFALALLLVLLSQAREDLVLGRLEAMELKAPPWLLNPGEELTCCAPEEELAKLLLQMAAILAEKLSSLLFCPSAEEGTELITQQLSLLLLFCTYMFQSGVYCRVAKASMDLVRGSDPSFPLARIQGTFVKLGQAVPMITLQWSCVLTLLNCNNQTIWAELLRTPTQRKGSFALEITTSEWCVNLEVVRRGGLILFCDYACENLSDGEQVTWLLVNHISDIVALAREPPVQELIAALNRSPGASGLLVQAIYTRCEDLSKPRIVSALLTCIEGVHLSQSGAVILLVVERLLGLPYLALARGASQLACRRAEMLLSLSIEEVVDQLPREDLEKIFSILHTQKLFKRYTQLVNLLNKLASQCYDMSPIECEDGRPFNPTAVASITVDKAWFTQQVQNRCCQQQACGYHCSLLLNQLLYEDILAIMSNKDFNGYLLKDCIWLGLQSVINKTGSCSLETLNDSHLYRASCHMLLNQVKHVISMLPWSHQVYYPHLWTPSNRESKYSQRLDEFFVEERFWNVFMNTVPAVHCYFNSVSGSVEQPDLTTETLTAIAKFALTCVQALVWVLRDEPFHIESIHCLLRSADAALQNDRVLAVFSVPEHASWVCSVVNSLATFLSSLLPNVTLPSVPTAGLTSALEQPQQKNAAACCLWLSSVLLWFEKIGNNKLLPPFMFAPFKNLVASISRTSLVNSFVFCPPEVWTMGWQPSMGGDFGTIAPPLPVEQLQEVEVLRQYIFRVNLLGWTSRQQFEETWMALLGVLNACRAIEDVSPEESAILVQSSCLAVRGMTSLLQQTMLQALGSPSNSIMIHCSRDRPLPFENSKNGQRCQSIQREIQSRLWPLGISYKSGGLWKQSANLERTGNRINEFGYGQLSHAYFQSVLKKNETGSGEFKAMEARLASSGVDVNSCVRFLLDLYAQWLEPQASIPLPLLCECVRSILCLSDLFTESSQFQWLLDSFLELFRRHPPEDDLMAVHLVAGIGKATAVLKMENDAGEQNKRTIEIALRSLESALRSNHLPTRLAGIHSLLMMLQAEAGRGVGGGGEDGNSAQLLPFAIDYIQRQLLNTQALNGESEWHLASLWALLFYIMEHFEDEMSDVELSPPILQMVLKIAANPPATLPTSLHLILFRGLERLVLSRSVTKRMAEKVTKLALEQIRSSSPSVALPALHLLIACMYIDHPSVGDGAEPEACAEVDPEKLLQAMERVSVLFDRLKHGYPFEVEILGHTLQALLPDFFPASEILNKLIAEFIAPYQPRPQHLAPVVFQVFGEGCRGTQQAPIKDWVVVSLPNFTQRSPITMAVWSLTCFFIAASQNPWLRAMFPHVQCRVGRLEYEDRKLFCIAALDFYHQLVDDNEKATFIATFQTAAQPHTPYADLVACLQGAS